MDAVPVRPASHGGLVWVRPIMIEPTPDESARMTAFAERQLGKPYCHFRILAHVTPFRARGPITEDLVPPLGGKGDQSAWFCSEQTAEALIQAGMLTPIRSSIVYPSDLFFDDRVDLSARWSPPLRWTSNCQVPDPDQWLWFPRWSYRNMTQGR